MVVFTSKRAPEHAELPEGWNLWRGAPGGSTAAVLPAPVNSTSSECCAVFSPDGSFLFSSDRAGSWDIYRARGETTFEVTRLEGSVNTEHDEWRATWHPTSGSRHASVRR